MPTLGTMTTSINQMPWIQDLEFQAFDTYTRTPKQSADWCKSEPGGDKNYKRMGYMGSLGTLISMTEGSAIPQDGYVNGPEKTVYPAKWGLRVSVTDEAKQTDRPGIYKKIGAELGKAAAYTLELMNYDLLNSGFSSSVRTGSDGKALFATDHPLYGVPGGTYNNLQTGALSKTTLQQAVNKMSRLVNERNIPIVMHSKWLDIPIELEWLAKELLLSPDDPTTANRSINSLTREGYNGGPLKYRVNPFLTSTTAWFISVDKSMQDLQTINFTAPKQESWRDHNTQTDITSYTMRQTPTFCQWRGWVGSTGT
jgi:hypothetical protein